jgi:hypothetical protein
MIGASLGELPFVLEKDFLLVEPQEVEARKVFTPFSKLWMKVAESSDISVEKYNL